MTFYKRFGKQFFDLLLSAFACPIFFPLLLFIAIIIRLVLGKPVFFQQDRVGINNKLFKLVKFRTMTNTHCKNGNLASDSERLTRLGQLLRRHSFDELPQFINVFKGEMSLVGPRPLLPEYLTLYSPEQSRRHNVKPGITGWAQVNGRNALSWEEKFRLDVWYVDHLSFWLDVRILWRTLIQVIRRQGISADGHATMPPFTGNQEDTRETT